MAMVISSGPVRLPSPTISSCVAPVSRATRPGDRSAARTSTSWTIGFSSFFGGMQSNSTMVPKVCRTESAGEVRHLPVRAKGEGPHVSIKSARSPDSMSPRISGFTGSMDADGEHTALEDEVNHLRDVDHGVA